LKALLAAPLTADAAVRIALLRNPAVQIEYAQLGLAAAEVFDASRIANPSAGLSILWAAPVDGGRKVDGSVTLGLIDLLWLRSRRKMAGDEFKAAQQRVAGSIFNLALDVQTAWLDALAASQRLAVREQIAEGATLTADLAERYRAAGNADALSLALAGAAASEAAIAVRTARREVTRAQTELRQRLGLASSDPKFSLPLSLPLPRSTAVQTDALRSAAHKQRLDLAAAQNTVNALERRLSMTRRYRWLGYSDVGVIGEREGTGISRRGVSAAASLPLFQQGQGAVARAAAELDRARAEQRQLEVAIDSELDSQLDQIEQTHAQYLLYREHLIPEREAAVARIAERVNFMLAGSFELLRARQQEYAAYEGSLNALHDYWQARLALARAAGGPLPQIVMEVQP
jgi:cobalt-zinc-cadmium efflux system outer membrane protein